MGMTPPAWLRWGCWYAEKNLPLAFPKRWRVTMCLPRGGKDIGEAGLKAAFERPIGTTRLRELAKGKRSAVIVVDDLTRPTPAARLLPFVIGELVDGGIPKERIRILIGIAAHHPLNREQMVRKLGKDIVAHFWVQNHCPFENLDYLGTTRNGTPVYLNREFLRADLKVCVGSILPHGHAGFGGGAKLVLPGVAGIESIYHNHRPDNGFRKGIALTEGNIAREDMEEAATMAGLDAIVNVVLNPQRGIVGCFVGHFIDAHRAGCELARRVYATPIPDKADVAILSAYPKDSEVYQCVNAFTPLSSAPKRFVHDEGTVVFASAGSEGMGTHYLAGPGMRLGAQRTTSPDRTVRPQRLYFAPTVNAHDLWQWGWDGEALCQSWREVVRRLRERYGDDCHIAVFPCAAMQLAEA
jgi:nickel-dependent lactate racemase